MMSILQSSLAEEKLKITYSSQIFWAFENIIFTRLDQQLSIALYCDMMSNTGGKLNIARGRKESIWLYSINFSGFSDLSCL